MKYLVTNKQIKPTSWKRVGHVPPAANIVHGAFQH